MPTKCTHCGAPTKLTCSSCKKLPVCSKSCFSELWTTHKQLCLQGATSVLDTPRYQPAFRFPKAPKKKQKPGVFKPPIEPYEKKENAYDLKNFIQNFEKIMTEEDEKHFYNSQEVADFIQEKAEFDRALNAFDENLAMENPGAYQTVQKAQQKIDSAFERYHSSYHEKTGMPPVISYVELREELLNIQTEVMCESTGVDYATYEKFLTLEDVVKIAYHRYTNAIKQHKISNLIQLEHMTNQQRIIREADQRIQEQQDSAMLIEAKRGRPQGSTNVKRQKTQGITMEHISYPPKVMEAMEHALRMSYALRSDLGMPKRMAIYNSELRETLFVTGQQRDEYFYLLARDQIQSLYEFEIPNLFKSGLEAVLNSYPAEPKKPFISAGEAEQTKKYVIADQQSRSKWLPLIISFIQEDDNSDLIRELSLIDTEYDYVNDFKDKIDDTNLSDKQKEALKKEVEENLKNKTFTKEDKENFIQRVKAAAQEQLTHTSYGDGMKKELERKNKIYSALKRRLIIQTKKYRDAQSEAQSYRKAATGTEYKSIMDTIFGKLVREKEKLLQYNKAVVVLNTQINADKERLEKHFVEKGELLNYLLQLQLSAPFLRLAIEFVNGVAFSRVPEHWMKFKERYEEYLQSIGQASSPTKWTLFLLMVGSGTALGYVGPWNVANYFVNFLWAQGGANLAAWMYSWFSNSTTAPPSEQKPNWSQRIENDLKILEKEENFSNFTQAKNYNSPADIIQTAQDAQDYLSEIAAQLQTTIESIESRHASGKDYTDLQTRRDRLEKMQAVYERDYGNTLYDLKARRAYMNAQKSTAIPKEIIEKTRETLLNKVDELKRAKTSADILQTLAEENKQFSQKLDESTTNLKEFVRSLGPNVPDIMLGRLMLDKCASWTEDCTQNILKDLDDKLVSYPPQYVFSGTNEPYQIEADGPASLATVGDSMCYVRKITTGSQVATAQSLPPQTLNNTNYNVSIPQSQWEAFGLNSTSQSSFSAYIQYPPTDDIVCPYPNVTFTGNSTLILKFLADVTSSVEPTSRAEMVPVVDTNNPEVVTVPNPPSYLLQKIGANLPVNVPTQIQFSEEDKKSLAQLFNSSSSLINYRNLPQAGKEVMQKVALRMMGEDQKETRAKAEIYLSAMKATADMMGKVSAKLTDTTTINYESIQKNIKESEEKIAAVEEKINKVNQNIAELLEKQHVFTPILWEETLQYNATHLISRESFDLMRQCALGVAKEHYAFQSLKDSKITSIDDLNNWFDSKFKSEGASLREETVQRWYAAGGHDILIRDIQTYSDLLRNHEGPVKFTVDKTAWNNITKRTPYGQWVKFHSTWNWATHSYAARAMYNLSNAVPISTFLFRFSGVYNRIFKPELNGVQVYRKPYDFDVRKKLYDKIDAARETQQKVEFRPGELDEANKIVEEYDKIPKDIIEKDIIYLSSLEYQRQYGDVLKEEQEIGRLASVRKIDVFADFFDLAFNVSSGASIGYALQGFAQMVGLEAYSFSVGGMLHHLISASLNSTILSTISEFAATNPYLASFIGLAGVGFLIYAYKKTTVAAVTHNFLTISSGLRSFIDSLMQKYCAVRAAYLNIRYFLNIGLRTVRFTGQVYHMSTGARDVTLMESLYDLFDAATPTEPTEAERAEARRTYFKDQFRGMPGGSYTYDFTFYQPGKYAQATSTNFLDYVFDPQLVIEDQKKIQNIPKPGTYSDTTVIDTKRDYNVDVTELVKPDLTTECLKAEYSHMHWSAITKSFAEIDTTLTEIENTQSQSRAAMKAVETYQDLLGLNNNTLLKALAQDETSNNIGSESNSTKSPAAPPPRPASPTPVDDFEKIKNQSNDPLVNPSYSALNGAGVVFASATLIGAAAMIYTRLRSPIQKERDELMEKTRKDNERLREMLKKPTPKAPVNPQVLPSVKPTATRNTAEDNIPSEQDGYTSDPEPNYFGAPGDGMYADIESPIREE